MIRVLIARVLSASGLWCKSGPAAASERRALFQRYPAPRVLPSAPALGPHRALPPHRLVLDLRYEADSPAHVRAEGR
eukprot:8731757-Alexandrium_andersonii.AAC.1